MIAISLRVLVAITVLTASAGNLSGGSPTDVPGEFDEPDALQTNWVTFVSGEPQAMNIELSPGDTFGRLRMGLATLQTDSRTVKWIGVRKREPIRLDSPAKITFTLDWNGQANGSYLSAGLMLSPHASSSPIDESNWLKIAYVGVPPGRNARLEVKNRDQGSVMTLIDEGWPQRNRSGRRISIQELEIVFRGEDMEIRENRKTVYHARQSPGYDQAYVYLFLTSHSNYGLREVYFENLRFQQPESPARTD